MSGPAHRLRLLVRRYGAVRATAVVVTGTVAGSLAFTWLAAQFLGHEGLLPLGLGIAFLAPLLVAPPVVWTLVDLVRTLDGAERRQRSLVEDLARTLDEVHALRVLLPVCASCKAVRDDSGYWHAVETFLRDHSRVRASHSLCPDCVRTHHPEHAETVLGAGPPAAER